MRRHQEKPYFSDYEDSSMMDMDDNDVFDMLGDGIVHAAETTKLKDADFFNSFEDDFDDSDIN
ncbi:hypothetical protein ACHQM5_014321 [Ranunculus cassubicifolius]